MGIIGICVRVTALLVLVMSSSTTGWGQSRLSSCPADHKVRWHNCFGTFTFADGDKYVGEFRDNKFNGQGTYTYADGAKYVGEYKDDKRNGQGTLTSASGTKYVGGWRDDKRNGQGTFTSADGAKYVGEYRDDKRNGQGTLTFASGNKYVGEFRDDKSHGQGTSYTRDGEAIRNGVWQGGDFVAANNLPRSVPSLPQISGAPGTILLVKEGGTFKVPVLINGVIPLHFTVDSGASDVRIPSDVVLTLVRTGTITNDDFIGEQTYVLADGSRVKSKTFRIRSLKVGDKVVENVLGSVADVKGSLLLGQSFLSWFKKVSFDYSQGTLVLE